MERRSVSTYLISSGCIVGLYQIALVVRLDIEAEKPKSVLLFSKNGNSHRFMLGNDFYVDSLINENNIYILGKSGHIISFSLDNKNSPDEIAQSKVEWRINDADEFGDLIRIRKIGDDLFCGGQCGQIYRLVSNTWERHDCGFRDYESPDFEDIGGEDKDDFYGVCLAGETYHFSKGQWKRIDVPTNENLLCIQHIQNQSVCIAGYGGLVMTGNDDIWRLIGHSNEKNYWDLALLEEKIFFAHGKGIDYMKNEKITAVEFNIDQKLTFHRLASYHNQLWSFGEKHVLFLEDGQWNIFEPDL
ncbi:hypothetical protein VSS37_09910 [Candidatus Thiothrix sp. Deng01]|uniref:Uncharacterized protein n=1 Tax=Candidatus Thiothrix phosphatis TaxID=3112415 RepID=A0ABU6CYZ3_9GAMM|nr:hypothetical protein [Candidatus Thiothrix sp. Deng01]MEB4591292.1 hypothetical protein [Candidatus Thiothrix sp. Deng01]